MQRTTLKLSFVTPCFLGGAEQTGAPEWRAASVRGQLRWWFRAIAGAHYKGDLNAVSEAEGRIFGNTKQASLIRIMTLGTVETSGLGRAPWWDPRMDEERLASAWGLQPNHPHYSATLERLKITDRDGNSVPSSPIQYLGYGCIGVKKLERPCILPEQAVRIRLQWLDRDLRALGTELGRFFAEALWGWLHLGGIGAKSRKGFGSLRCTAVQGELPGEVSKDLVYANPTSKDFLRGVRRLLGAGKSCAAAEWTHLSQDSRIYFFGPCSSWTDAMARIGGWLIAFRRRYGYRGDVRRRNSMPLKDRDYTWASPSAEGSTSFRQECPDRSGFGLPLPFEKKSHGRPIGETVNWQAAESNGSRENRRASPLLIHIAKFNKSQFVPVLTHLPARFLPEDAVLTFKRGSQTSLPTSEQADVIAHFFDDLLHKNLVEEIKT